MDSFAALGAVVLFFGVLVAISIAGKALYDAAVEKNFRTDISDADPQGIGDSWETGEAPETPGPIPEIPGPEMVVTQPPSVKLPPAPTPEPPNWARSWVEGGNKQVGWAEQIQKIRSMSKEERLKQEQEARERMHREALFIQEMAKVCLEGDGTVHAMLGGVGYRMAKEQLKNIVGADLKQDLLSGRDPSWSHAKVDAKFKELVDATDLKDKKGHELYLAELYRAKTNVELLEAIKAMVGKVGEDNPHMVAACAEAELRQKLFQNAQEGWDMLKIRDKVESPINIEVKAKVEVEATPKSSETFDAIAKDVWDEQPKKAAKKVVKRARAKRRTKPRAKV